MCLLCDDEKAYQAYMNYLDAMERQGKAADPDKAVDAVLDQLEADRQGRAGQQDKSSSRTIRPTTRRSLPSSAARSINDRFDIADARRGPRGPREQVLHVARTDRRPSQRRSRRRARSTPSCWRRRSRRSPWRARPTPRSRGEGGAAGRHAARHQGPVLHQGRAHHRGLEDPRQLHAALRSRPSPPTCGATAR